MRTIEQDLMEALVKAGVVTQDHADAPGAKVCTVLLVGIQEDIDAGNYLVHVNVCNKVNEYPSFQMHFQRAARTDKGVSAAGQVCSLKMSII